MLQSRSPFQTLAQNLSNSPSPSSRQGRLFPPFGRISVFSSLGSRASVRHTEDADGCDALSDEAIAQCGDRNGAERTQLQSHACAEHRRRQAIAGSHAGVRRGQWTQRRHRRPPHVARRCKEVDARRRTAKNSEIAALVSVTVSRERLRNAEPRFYTAWTRTGHRPFRPPAIAERRISAIFLL
jgi:hypothetical protein